MKLPYNWLCDLVKVPGDPDQVATTLGLRGFEVASVHHGRQPVIDFEITANRPDCLNVVGLAREASAAYAQPLQYPDRTMPPAGQPSLDKLGTALSPVEGPQSIDITIEDAELCPRYCAQVFEVRSTGHTPEWMRDRLEACGVRSISPIVDVTNYVMLEMGQPTHAFDYAKLAGRALRIRRARAGETLRTLDGVDRALEAGMLVIADAERPQAVGGVMGGAASEIDGATRLMVLESAYFKPASVRRTSKRLGLKTEASTRFERGADVNAAPAAIARAAALLQQIGAAQPLGPTIDKYPAPQPPLTLTLRASRIERVLGMRVADAEVPTILGPLGFDVRPASARTPAHAGYGEASPKPLRGEGGDASREAGGERRADPGSGIDAPRTSHLPPPTSAEATAGTPTSWTVHVPSYRVDVLREIDLIEEIARHDGYKGLPATFPELTVPQPPPDARTLRDRLLRQILTACGMSEAMTFAFIEEAAAAPFAAAECAEHVDKAAAESADRKTLVAVANPLSEKYAVLRPSLLPGLIDAAAHNRRREHHDIRLFETGTCFSPAGETRAVAGVWCGAGTIAHWSGGARAADFHDVKGVVEALGRALGVELDYEPASVAYLVEGRTAEVFFRLKAEATRSGDSWKAEATGSPSGNPVASAVRRKVGLIGQVHPAILDARGFPPAEELWAFELDVDALAARRNGADAGDDLRAESLPRFPSVVRDLSVLVDSTLPAAAVRGTIRTAAPSLLAHAIEFDRYRGKGVPDGRVSLSLRLTFRSPERTLTDAEVDEAMARIVDALASAHGAVRR